MFVYARQAYINIRYKYLLSVLISSKIVTKGVIMELEEFLEYIKTGQTIKANSPAHRLMHRLSQEAMKITCDMNNAYRAPEELCRLFSKLTGRKTPEGFALFPPFYTDCGKNIHLGENVFINSSCHFQDQGGIYLGNNVLIGHNVTLATLNHAQEPKDRGSMIPKAIHIGDNVWIGSDSTILPGVTIGNGAIIGAGSVVTKDVASYTAVAGVPARFIKNVEEEI